MQIVSVIGKDRRRSKRKADAISEQNRILLENPRFLADNSRATANEVGGVRVEKKPRAGP